MEYDIGIIGAGPGGYVAAIRSAHRGKRVVLFEKDEVGGTCLNRGCIPTKAIASSAELLERVRRARELGIEAGNISFDLSKIIERKDKIVSRIVNSVLKLIEGNGVELIKGTASLKSPNTVVVEGHEIEVRNIIIATGSSWINLPGLEPDGKSIVTSDEMLSLKTLPRRILIIGGGIIGCEFASFLNSLGSEVTIVELKDRLLPMEDPAIGRLLRRSFESRGIKIYTGVTVREVLRDAPDNNVILSDGSRHTADKIMVSVGRRPVTNDLGLEALGIETERGFIIVDEYLRTNVKNIYAIGDVIGNYMLAHVASKEGMTAADNICGDNIRMRYDAVPRPIFTRPEIAAVGLTEDEIKRRGMKYSVGRFSFQAIPKAVCDGTSDGMMTVYAGKDEEILGAFIVGPNATDIISQVALAITSGLKTRDLAAVIYPHPTNSEIIKEAVEDVEDKAIHKVRMK